MDLEVLVSTMKQKDISLADRMNISSKAIFINQSDSIGYEEWKKEDSLIRMYTLNERGVGLSRNTALMRSRADICLLGDDDVVYVSNYEEIILNEFKKNPKADLIIFTVNIIDKKGEKQIPLKNRRVNFFNILRYGAVRIAFKRETIIKNNIYFSLLFGGGAKHGSGEDSIFLADSLRKGLRIYTNSNKIADVYNYDSSWFNGYNKKFFFDKGALFQKISPRLSHLLILNFILRKYNTYKNEMTIIKAYRYMKKGAKCFKQL